MPPSGIEEEVEGEEGDQELEIEIVDPEMVTLDDGSVEITIVPGEMKGENGFGDIISTKAPKHHAGDATLANDTFFF